MKFLKVSNNQYEEDLRKFIEKKKPEKVLTLNEVTIPKRLTSGSAGYDFIIPVTIKLKPGERTALIPTGIRCKLENNCVLLLFVRSSVGIKKGVILSNGTGVIDSDYFNADNEGHIQFSLLNTSTEEVIFNAGERVIQGTVIPFVISDDENKDFINERKGGFGSTN